MAARGKAVPPNLILDGWQVRRVVLAVERNRPVLRLAPDDQIATVVGKYSWITQTADEMRDEDRRIR